MGLVEISSKRWTQDANITKSQEVDDTHAKRKSCVVCSFFNFSNKFSVESLSYYVYMLDNFNSQSSNKFSIKLCDKYGVVSYC